MHEKRTDQAHGEARQVSRWHAIWQVLFALDVLYITAAVLACVGIAIYAVVNLDAETLVVAVVGLATAFVLGCIIYGVQNLGRRR